MRTLAVFLCLLYFANATTFHALTELTTAPQAATWTAQWVDTTTPVLTGSLGPTTFDATTQNPLAISFTFTYAGNITVSSVAVTLVSGSNVIKGGAGVVCATGTCTATNGGYFTFTATGSYTASIVVTYAQTGRSKSYTSADLGGLTGANKWNTVMVSTVRAIPTPSGLVIASPQALGCESASSCTSQVYWNATIANPINTDNYALNFIVQSDVAASGVVWYMGGTCVSGSCTPISNGQPLGWDFGAFDSQTNQFGSVGGPGFHNSLIPNGATFTVSHSSVTQSLDSWSFSTTGFSVKANSGSADQTAPTCTTATLSPLTQTTGTTAGLTYTVACTDNTGGSGVAQSGVFLAHTGSDGTVVNGYGYQPTSGGPIFVPTFQSGQTTIIGVFAVDFAGNTAMYGSCGSFSWTLCGSNNTSSAVSLTVQLFGLVMLVLISMLL